MWWRTRRSPAALEQRQDVGRLAGLLERADLERDRQGRAIDLAGSTRVAAAAALGRLGDGRAVPTLHAATRDPIAEVRHAAASALVGFGGTPTPLDELCELATRDDESVEAPARASAIDRLDQADADGCERVLRTLLERGGRADAVCELLGRLGNRLAPDAYGEVCEAALRQLGDADPAARARARRFLEHVRPAPRGALEAALSDPPIAVEALTVLGNLRDMRATPAIADSLQSPDSVVRESACRALERIQDPRAIPALLAVSVDPAHAVRAASIRALEALGPLVGVVTAARLVSGDGDGDASRLLPASSLTALFSAPAALPAADAEADAEPELDPED